MYDVKHPNICKIKDLEIIKELLSLLLTDMPSQKYSCCSDFLRINTTFQRFKQYFKAWIGNLAEEQSRKQQ